MTGARRRAILPLFIGHPGGRTFGVERLFTFTAAKGATMSRNDAVTAGLVAMALASGIVIGRGARVEAQMQGRMFELRTSTTMEGRLEALMNTTDFSSIK
jgi:hypothetical protein